jgi:hypothetical protein
MGVPAEVSALREVLPEQAVGVLVRSALPGTVGVCEVDRHACIDADLGVLGHLRTLVPGEGLAETGDKFTFQSPAALDVEGLVDRLVRDTHGVILGEVGPQPVGDLLRAP